MRCETVNARALKVTGIGSERVKLEVTRRRPRIPRARRTGRTHGSWVHLLLPHLFFLRAITVLHHLPLLHDVHYISVRTRHFIAISCRLVHQHVLTSHFLRNKVKTIMPRYQQPVVRRRTHAVRKDVSNDEHLVACWSGKELVWGEEGAANRRVRREGDVGELALPHGAERGGGWCGSEELSWWAVRWALR